MKNGDMLGRVRSWLVFPVVQSSRGHTQQLRRFLNGIELYTLDNYQFRISSAERIDAFCLSPPKILWSDTLYHKNLGASYCLKYEAIADNVNNIGLATSNDVVVWSILSLPVEISSLYH